MYLLDRTNWSLSIQCALLCSIQENHDPAINLPIKKTTFNALLFQQAPATPVGAGSKAQWFGIEVLCRSRSWDSNRSRGDF